MTNKLFNLFHFQKLQIQNGIEIMIQNLNLKTLKLAHYLNGLQKTITNMEQNYNLLPINHLKDFNLLKDLVELELSLDTKLEGMMEAI